MEKCITNTRDCVLITELIFVGAIEGAAEQSTAGGACDDEEDDWIGNPGISDFVELWWWVCETTVKQLVKKLRNKTHPRLLFIFFLLHQYFCERCWNKFSMTHGDAETSSGWHKGDVKNWFRVTRKGWWNWFSVTQGEVFRIGIWLLWSRRENLRFGERLGNLSLLKYRMFLIRPICFCKNNRGKCGGVCRV